MAYLFLICALCEAFLVRFLLALVKESRYVSLERKVVPRGHAQVEWGTCGSEQAVFEFEDDELSA